MGDKLFECFVLVSFVSNDNFRLFSLLSLCFQMLSNLLLLIVHSALDEIKRPQKHKAKHFQLLIVVVWQGCGSMWVAWFVWIALGVERSHPWRLLRGCRYWSATIFFCCHGYRPNQRRGICLPPGCTSCSASAAMSCLVCVCVCVCECTWLPTSFCKPSLARIKNVVHLCTRFTFLARDDPYLVSSITRWLHKVV